MIEQKPFFETLPISDSSIETGLINPRSQVAIIREMERIYEELKLSSSNPDSGHSEFLAGALKGTREAFVGFNKVPYYLEVKPNEKLILALVNAEDELLLPREYDDPFDYKIGKVVALKWVMGLRPNIESPDPISIPELEGIITSRNYISI